MILKISVTLDIDVIRVFNVWDSVLILLKSYPKVKHVCSNFRVTKSNTGSVLWVVPVNAKFNQNTDKYTLNSVFCHNQSFVY